MDAAEYKHVALGLIFLKYISDRFDARVAEVKADPDEAFLLDDPDAARDLIVGSGIRRKMIEANLVDCVVSLPGQLFSTTQIPVCLWFLTRDKSNGLVRDKTLRDRTAERDIRQLLSKAVMADGILDVFKSAGLNQPDLSIFSDEFLAEVRGTKQKNLAVETLRRLLADEIKAHARTNIVQSQKLSERLDETLRKYHNRAVDSVQVIEELIALANDIRTNAARAAELGLSQEEVAFYEALAEKRVMPPCRSMRRRISSKHFDGKVLLSLKPSSSASLAQHAPMKPWGCVGPNMMTPPGSGQYRALV